MSLVWRTLQRLVLLGVVGVIVGAAGFMWVLYEYGRGLPDYRQLVDYEPPVMSRVHAGDGRLIAEFARERRVFVPIEAIPVRVSQAFVSAEDQNFYSHPGVDPIGIVRAVFTNVKNVAEGRRLVGASTITQQVAKNFLLTNEVSFERKIKEAILALRMERTLSKDRILELYLNEIYLGRGSYGVAAAALNYFGKSLDEMSLQEIAYLAALPKAPNNYHPIRQRDAAVGRRNYVLTRMAEDRFIDLETRDRAQAAPLIVDLNREIEIVEADYFVEEVRRELIAAFGEDKTYHGGLSVRTTLDSRLQALAQSSLRWGLEAYDRRHGYRGPLVRIDAAGDWREALRTAAIPRGVPDTWSRAVVLEVTDAAATVGLAGGDRRPLPLEELTWARQYLSVSARGPRIRAAGDVVAVGDVIYVTEAGPDDAGNPRPDAVSLRQIPEVSGGIVAMDPHTGRVRAMAGGFSFTDSQFNRATQALRQPGSSFKLVVYAAALENGYTPASRVLDAPFVIDQGPGQGKWRPSNYSDKFYGPSTLRLGVEKSRNLMTIRLAHDMGMETISAYSQKLGVTADLPPLLSMALGAGSTTLLDMTTAYAQMVNGGKQITPSLIDRVQNRYGENVFRHDGRPCAGCTQAAWQSQTPPQLPDTRAQVVSAATAYQMVSMFEGVVERGTGRRIGELGRPLAGKTGTTNREVDAWFIGFSPDLAVGVFVGFDDPLPMGRRETGSSVAAPIFKRFMAEALADEPIIPFRIPPGVRLVRIDPATGGVAQPGQSAILEAFVPGTEPTDTAGAVLDGSQESFTSGRSTDAGTGGLY